MSCLPHEISPALLVPSNQYKPSPSDFRTAFDSPEPPPTQTQKNELKKERRAAKGDEDDIDALLARCLLEDKARTVLTLEVDCTPPTARVNASFVPYIAPVRAVQ